MTDQPTGKSANRPAGHPPLAPTPQPPTHDSQPPAVLDGDAVRRAAGLAPRDPAPRTPGNARDDELLLVVIPESAATSVASSDITAFAASLPWALGPHPARWLDNPSTGPVLLVVAYYPRTYPTGVTPAASAGETGEARMPVIAGIARVDSTQWRPSDTSDTAEPIDPDLAERWTVPVVQPLQDPTGGTVTGALLNLGYEIGWPEPDEQWATL